MCRSARSLGFATGLAIGALVAVPAGARDRRAVDVQASLDAMTRHDPCARDDGALRKLTHALGRSETPTDKPRRNQP